MANSYTANGESMGLYRKPYRVVTRNRTLPELIRVWQLRGQFAVSYQEFYERKWPLVSGTIVEWIAGGSGHSLPMSVYKNYVANAAEPIRP